MSWHHVLHIAAASVLVAAGVPVLVVAWRRRGGRAVSVARGASVRGAIFAILTVAAAATGVSTFVAAARTTEAPATLLAGACAVLCVWAVRRASRHARFASVVTIPAIGIVGLATLLLVAGPQPPAADGHGSPAHHEHAP